jgi:predicted CoA-substrate-specific enzyme activase
MPSGFCLKMLTAGIDLGTKTTRVIVLNDDTILAQRAVLTGWEPQHAGENALAAALEDARRARDDLARIVATGAGRQAFSLAQHNVTEVTADARALAFLHPRVRTALDVGAEEARAFKIAANGRVLDFAVNEKCAAGAGVFLETMARTLEVTLDEMSALAQQATGAVTLNSQCTVFAESEVVSLIHAQTPRAEIARAVFASIAARVASLARRIGIEAEVALVGGIAHSVAFVAALQHELGMEIQVPRDPEYIGALGAALIASDSVSLRGA